MGWCQWFDQDEMYRPYHRDEWGRPCHEDRKLFEYLMLECLQCGLSWSLVMRRRPVFDTVFSGWDWRRIQNWTESDIKRAIETDGMLRSPRKVRAIVGNAKAFAAVVSEWGSFDRYIWHFSGYKTIRYARKADARLPRHNGLATIIATDLRNQGFSYVGPTTVYAFLQSVGVVNDHDEDCEIGKEILSFSPYEIRQPDNEVE